MPFISSASTPFTDYTASLSAPSMEPSPTCHRPSQMAVVYTPGAVLFTPQRGRWSLSIAYANFLNVRALYFFLLCFSLLYTAEHSATQNDVGTALQRQSWKLKSHRAEINTSAREEYKRLISKSCYPQTSCKNMHLKGWINGCLCTGMFLLLVGSSVVLEFFLPIITNLESLISKVNVAE